MMLRRPYIDFRSILSLTYIIDVDRVLDTTLCLDKHYSLHTGLHGNYTFRDKL
jgi:hypothetical protein